MTIHGKFKFKFAAGWEAAAPGGQQLLQWSSKFQTAVWTAERCVCVSSLGDARDAEPAAVPPGVPRESAPTRWPSGAIQHWDTGTSLRARRAFTRT